MICFLAYRSLFTLKSCSWRLWWNRGCSSKYSEWQCTIQVFQFLSEISHFGRNHVIFLLCLSSKFEQCTTNEEGVSRLFYPIIKFQKWARAKDAKRKSEKTLKDEINHLRNELAKISNEMRHYQLLERNNATLLKEVNSLKAILVGRYFISFILFSSISSILKSVEYSA